MTYDYDEILNCAMYGYRYGGGPDLKYYEDCTICSIAWRKHQRTHIQRASSRATSFADSFSGSGDGLSNHMSSSFLSKSVHNVNLFDTPCGGDY